MPQVVYRESTKESRDLEEEKTMDEDKIKDDEIDEQKGEVKKKTNSRGEQEMLNAMDLLVALNDKIIDEDVFVTLPRKPLKRLSKEVEMSKAAKVETQHVLVKGRKMES